MPNPFDMPASAQALEGMGFVKKLKKAAKKARKKVTKVIRKTPIGRKVYDEQKRVTQRVSKEVKRSPVAQAAILAAGAMVLGPAVGAFAKGGFAAAGKAAAGAATKSALAKTAATAATKAGLKQATQKAAQSQVKKSQRAIQAEQAQAVKIQEISAMIAANPEFAHVVDQMQKRGASVDEIIAAWGSSNTYAKIAVPEVAQQIYPTIFSSLQNQGYEPESAASVAHDVADQVAAEAVSSTQKNLELGKIVKYALPIGALALTLLNK